MPEMSAGLHSRSAKAKLIEPGLRAPLRVAAKLGRDSSFSREAQRSALSGLGGLLQKPADSEDQDTAGRNHQRVLQSHFFGPEHVAGNSGRAYQQPQKLKKSG